MNCRCAGLFGWGIGESWVTREDLLLRTPDSGPPTVPKSEEATMRPSDTVPFPTSPTLQAQPRVWLFFN